MPRLALSTLGQVPQAITRPAYDITQLRIGILHFGPGAFFRAHQAAYVNRLLARDQRWGITAVALHSTAMRDALAPQDGLYTLAELERETRLQVIGAIRECLVAPETPGRVLARLASPDLHLVTLTVTEKGYGLTDSGEIDPLDPAIHHDLAHPAATPTSVIGWLVAGLKARHAAGIAPFTTLSCDNLPDNGGKLGRAVAAFARATGEAALADWIETRASFPRTMVDSITPATDAALRARVEQALGLEDAWPIQREAFCQWVIEDALGAQAPDLAAAGATLTKNVNLFEQAKLRLLNGPHSALAYIGRLAGLETVAQAMAEPALAGFLARLMREDIAPSLAPSLTTGDGLDLADYSAAILRRFANPALRHELAQIAWDGSKKLPIRLLATIGDALADGRGVERLAVPVAAWMLFVRAQQAAGRALTDPLAALLNGCVAGAPDGDPVRFLSLESVFPPALAQHRSFRQAIHTAHRALRADVFQALV